MITLVRDNCGKDGKDCLFFDSDVELKQHAWCPYITITQAEQILINEQPYTYITYPKQGERGYTLSFVNSKSCIEHHFFTLVDKGRGIWLNGAPDHVGSLAKVVRDMMGCALDEGQPLF